MLVRAIGLTDEANDEPQKQLKIALKVHRVDSTRFGALDFGESLMVNTKAINK